MDSIAATFDICRDRFMYRASRASAIIGGDESQKESPKLGESGREQGLAGAVD